AHADDADVIGGLISRDRLDGEHHLGLGRCPGAARGRTVADASVGALPFLVELRLRGQRTLPGPHRADVLRELQDGGSLALVADAGGADAALLAAGDRLADVDAPGVDVHETLRIFAIVGAR